MVKIPTRESRSRIARIARRITGTDYEQRGRRWLEKQGMAFIAANVYSLGGEIDLIMRQQHTTVFVEVRYRKSLAFGGAAASVDHHKQQKLLRAAQGWLAQHNGSFDTVDCRFDVLAFTGDNGDKIEWIQNAFG